MMARSEVYTGSATVGSTEFSFVSGNTTLQSIAAPGVYQMLVDTAAVTTGDQYRFKVKEKVRAADAQRVVFQTTPTGKGTDSIVYPPLLLLNGFDFTGTKVAGTDRAIGWSVRKTVGGTITEAYTGTNASWATEYSLPNASTTLTPITAGGVYQPWLDVSALAPGDLYRVTIKEKIRSAGTQRVIETFYIPPQGEVWVGPTLDLYYGWDVTVQRVTGSDRAITWSLRQVT